MDAHGDPASGVAASANTGGFLTHNIVDASGNAWVYGASLHGIYTISSSYVFSTVTTSAPSVFSSLAFNPLNSTLNGYGTSGVYTVNTLTGATTTFASVGMPGNWADGLWFDPSGNLYTNNSGNVTKVTTSGASSTFYANASVDNTGQGVCDASGNVYISNRNANTILQISPAGVVTKTLNVSCNGNLWGMALLTNGNIAYNCNSSTIYELNVATGTIPRSPPSAAISGVCRWTRRATFGSEAGGSAASGSCQRPERYSGTAPSRVAETPFSSQPRLESRYRYRRCTK